MRWRTPRGSGVIKRLALIHALAHSVAPINDALARDWPQATRMNLLDDSLSSRSCRQRQGAGRRDARAVPASGAVRGRLRQRRDSVHLLGLRPVHRGGRARACPDAGAQTQRGHGGAGGQSGLPHRPDRQFRAHAAAPCRPSFHPTPTCAANWWKTPCWHSTPARRRATTRWWWQPPSGCVNQGCAVIALAQFSMARARRLVAEHTGLPVLTTVDSAVSELRRRLGAG